MIDAPLAPTIHGQIRLSQPLFSFVGFRSFDGDRVCKGACDELVGMRCLWPNHSVKLVDQENCKHRTDCVGSADETFTQYVYVLLALSGQCGSGGRFSRRFVEMKRLGG